MGMTSQIRAATFAFLAGLAISLLIQAASLVGADNAKLFDPSNLFNPGFLSYWTARLAAVPLIFVVIAIISTARKAGPRSSIVAGFVAAVLVSGVSFVITWAVIAGTAAPQLMKEFSFADPLSTKEYPFADAGIARTIFVKGASSSCTERQKSFSENKAVSAAAIDAFCSCVGGALADVITRDEFAAVGRHEAPGPGLAEKSRTASQKCSPLMRGQQ
jgi:hypothetical protein